MISVPNLPQALETGLRRQVDDWDERRLHVSDLAAAIEEKCPRQLWLRLQGAAKKELTAGKLLMFRHGNRIHKDLVDILNAGLADGWQIKMVEQRVELNTVVGRYDTNLINRAENMEIIVDFKTVRGNKFNYLNDAMPSHVLQVQAYITGAEANGGLVFYVDREGQNTAKQFYVKRDDNKVWAAVNYVENLEMDILPPVLLPLLKISKNKGPDSVKLAMPWQCDYCDYLDVSCEGALTRDTRGLGIIGYLDGEFIPKQGFEYLAELVEELRTDKVPF